MSHPNASSVCRAHFLFLSLDFSAEIKYTVLGSKPDAPARRINPRQPQGGAVFYCGITTSLAGGYSTRKSKQNPVRFCLLMVGTTGHSPDGESVLQMPKISFYGCDASRRTCARRNSFTHNGVRACAPPAYLGCARDSRRWVVLQHSKRDGVCRPFCYAGGDNRTRTCDLLYVKQAL